jgi:hypothetical protein
MEYIVSQIILESQEVKDNVTTNTWGLIIRRVYADSEETAIGKFVIKTGYITAKEKLGISCIDSSRLSTLQ